MDTVVGIQSGRVHSSCSVVHAAWINEVQRQSITGPDVTSRMSAGRLSRIGHASFKLILAHEGHLVPIDHEANERILLGDTRKATDRKRLHVFLMQMCANFKVIII